MYSLCKSFVQVNIMLYHNKSNVLLLIGICTVDSSKMNGIRAVDS